MSSNGIPALDDGLVLSIRGVGKCYEMYAHPSHRLLQSLIGRRRKFYREFWALRDVSFDVGRGQCVGIVGQNGAGKSTLLQIATGILSPTTGLALSRGRIVSMLELGSGSVIELDRQVDDPVELLLDGKVIARGEAVIVDGKYGLRVTEIPQPIASHFVR